MKPKRGSDIEKNICTVSNNHNTFGASLLGISSITGVSFGTLMLLSSIPLLIFIFIKRRTLVGIGTVIAMFAIGYLIDFFYFFMSNLILIELSLPVRVGLLVVTLMLLALGCALTITADLGLIAYDAIGIVFEDMTGGKIKFRWIRLGMDLFFAVLAFVLGATVGIATALTVFIVGPFVNFFRDKLQSSTKHWFNKAQV
jgi:uncharacterized membrane protein YczE